MVGQRRYKLFDNILIILHNGKRCYTQKFSYKELQKKSNCDRALEHFDDFYGTFYGKKKWPQLRLGLLSPTKYVAIPNPFTGSLDRIASKLERMGAYNLANLWDEGRLQLAAEKKLVDVKKDMGRIHALEKTLESIAVTKRAEEIDVMYRRTSQKEGQEGFDHTQSRMWTSSSSPSYNNLNAFDDDSNRVFSHPSQAAFVPPTKLKGLEDFAFDSEYYAGFLPQNLHPLLDPDDDHPFVYSNPAKSKTVSQTISWPPPFIPYTFELGSGEEFPGSQRDPASGLREYICINGASIVPVLALDINPSVELLDMCAGPGTKSLMALMTMSLGSIVCNDVDSSRLFRIKNILKEFTGTSQPEQVTYTKFNGKGYPSGKKFNRVLADVPCLNDRVSVSVLDNNIFKTTRTKERLNLVNVQKAILLSSLKSMSKADGSVTVYSTCTLSPVENDGVIMHALKETDVENLAIDLYGLLSLLKPFEHRGFFRISRTRFGVLIEPSIVSNFGPMFVSRIIVQKQTEPEIVTTAQLQNVDEIQNNQDGQDSITSPVQEEENDQEVKTDQNKSTSDNENEHYKS